MKGYGPQETWKDEDKMPFFVALEEEIAKALMESSQLSCRWMPTANLDVDKYKMTPTQCL